MTILNRPTANSTLLIDAVVSGATGLLLLAAADPLSDLLNLPASLLRVSGGIMIPWFALLVAIATRPTISRMAMEVVIAGNLLWVAGSIILLIGDWVDPNALGYAFVIVQAVVVALFALMQIVKSVELGKVQPWTAVTHG